MAAIGEHFGPHHITVAFYHGMGSAKFVSFVRVKGCVNAAEHHIGAAFACQFADFVSPEGIGGMDANTHNISSLNTGWIHGVESFVNQRRIAKSLWGCGCQHIQPARSYDRGTKGNFARIDEVNAHAIFALLQCLVSGMPSDILPRNAIGFLRFAKITQQLSLARQARRHCQVWPYTKSGQN